MALRYLAGFGASPSIAGAQAGIAALSSARADTSTARTSSSSPSTNPKASRVGPTTSSSTAVAYPMSVAPTMRRSDFFPLSPAGVATTTASQIAAAQSFVNQTATITSGVKSPGFAPGIGGSTGGGGKSTSSGSADTGAGASDGSGSSSSSLVVLLGIGAAAWFFLKRKKGAS